MKMASLMNSELRTKVVGILRNSKPSKSNINKADGQAPKSLQENKDISILPVGKGKVVVVMDREDYQSQCEKPLADKDSYKEMETKNPTKLLKGIIQRKFMAIKKAGHIDPNIYTKYNPPQIPHLVSMPHPRYTQTH